MDQEIPYPLRLDGLIHYYFCVRSTIGIVKCSLFGPPGYIEDLADEFAKQNELASLHVEQIKKNSIELSDIEIMRTIE